MNNINPAAPGSHIQYLQSTPMAGLQSADTTGVLSHFSEEEADSPIESVPPELVLHIFGFLSQSNQGRASCVCRLWRDVAADDTLLTTSYLKRRFPLLQVLDERVWKTLVNVKVLGLDFNDVPPLEPRMIPELERLCTLPIEGNAGITLAFLPTGLTFNMLRLPEFHKQGNPAKFRHIWQKVSENFGNIPVDKVRWFGLSNSIIKGTRRLPFSSQREIVKTMGCDIPGLLEVTSVVFLTYMNSPAESPTRLLSDKPQTYMCCSPEIDGYPLAVGGFAPGSLDVGSYFYCDFFGAGAQQNF